MRRAALTFVAATLLAASAAAAQSMEHGMQGMTMPGMAMPAVPKPAGKASAKTRAKPRPMASDPAVPHRAVPSSISHASHAAPGAETSRDGRAEAPAADMMAGMAMGPAPPDSITPVGTAPAPAPPGDHYADRSYPPAAMAAARAQLRAEHGGQRLGEVVAKLAEYQVRNGRGGYRWNGAAWFGGDIDRAMLTTQGEGEFGRRADRAELQALYAHALDPYWTLHAGLRQDFGRGRDRRYATIGIEGLAPYWLDVEGALFLSPGGRLLGRLEASYDQRLTQRLILQPRAELNFAAQTMAADRIGAGLVDAELGLRLRYELRREFAPYLGLSWERRVGETARLYRQAGEHGPGSGMVIGVRAWF